MTSIERKKFNVEAVARGAVELRGLAAKARAMGDKAAAATYAAQASSAERSVRRHARVSMNRLGGVA